MNFKNDWGLPSEDPSQNLSNNSMLPSENQEKSGGVQNLTEPKTILEAAHAYCNAGLSVIPTGHDKVPLGPWKQYQNKAADEATRSSRILGQYPVPICRPRNGSCVIKG